MIDDFETGYSSLSYLKNFPVEVTAEGVETAEHAQQLRSDGARPHPRLLLFEAPPRQKAVGAPPNGELAPNVWSAATLTVEYRTVTFVKLRNWSQTGAERERTCGAASSMLYHARPSKSPLKSCT